MPRLPALIDARRPIGRGLYLRTGLALGVFKYLVDASVIFAFSGKWIPPLIYLMPLATLRMRFMTGVPSWVLAALVLWTIPFAWFGLNWSARRARDAGFTPLVSVLFLVPFLNYLAIAALSLVPTRTGAVPRGALRGEERVIWAAISGSILGAAGIASLLGVLAVGWSVYVVQQYGLALFLGTPFAVGMVASFLYNLRRDHGWPGTLLVSTLTLSFIAGFLLLLAMEGVLCIAMAAPIALVTTLLGAWLGRALASAEGRYGIIGPMALLPVLGGLEPPSPEARLREVLTEVDVAAPPEVVWRSVVAFPEIALEAPAAWFFRLGIAYPIRATIDGQGVGAVRRCSFSTGDFVEPITAWEPPNRLAFDVVEAPPTMHEWSPYRSVWAPHLDGVFQSVRGEFRLIPLPGGGTRLQGRTWYRFEMEPMAYWALWSDAIVHAIHARVLEHVRLGAEAAGA